MTHRTDVVIIGSGPVGLFSIFQCGMMKLSCHVVDALDHVGGQCSALYPEKPIYDIPAYPMITGQDLVDRLMEQAAPFKATYHLGQKVESVCETPTGWSVMTSRGIHIECGAIIIAAGVGAFGPNRPPLKNLEDYEGKSVFYHVGQKNIFEGKKIVIGGGGDSAVDWAVSLSSLAKHIYVVHRRPKFRAAPETVSQMEQLSKEGKITLMTPYQLDGLEGENGQLTSVILKNMDGSVVSVDTDYLLPFYGLSSQLGPISTWGLSLDNSHITIDPANHMTNQKGIFAIGDVVTYPGKMKLILTGFAEAARAAHSAWEILNPGQSWHFEHSTTSGVPGQKN